jgi:hypothetical protein
VYGASPYPDQISPVNTSVRRLARVSRNDLVMTLSVALDAIAVRSLLVPALVACSADWACARQPPHPARGPDRAADPGTGRGS